MFNEYTSSKNFDASSGLTQEKIVYTCGGLGTFTETGTTEYTVVYQVNSNIPGSYVGREKCHVRFPSSGVSWVQVTYHYKVFGISYTVSASMEVVVGTPAYTPDFTTVSGVCSTGGGTFKASTTQALPTGTTGYSWSASNATLQSVTAQPYGPGSIATFSFPANSSPVVVTLRYTASCSNVASPTTSKTLQRNQVMPTDDGATFYVTLSPTPTPAKKTATVTFSSCYWSVTKSSIGSNGQYQSGPSTTGNGGSYSVLMIPNDILSVSVWNQNTCGSSPSYGWAYKLVNGTLQSWELMRPNTTTELEDTNGEPALKIFPNPASSSVSVALENMPDANYNLSLYDVVGKKVQETVKIAGNRADLDVSGLQNGIYFLNVENDNSVIKKERIVVNH